MLKLKSDLRQARMLFYNYPLNADIMNMKYFFVLGNNPGLSAAEISAVFGLGKAEGKKHEFLAKSNVFILDAAEKINAEQMIKRLGGTIKIGRIRFNAGRTEEKEILEKIISGIKPGPGKFKFGISYYGRKPFNAKKLAMEIKRRMKEGKVNSRWVTSREKTLSSVVVEENKLIEAGLEAVLLEKKDKVYIGETEAVQAFKELSFRDYGRPQRDDRSGMLPPKLAQIMLNLSGAKSAGKILDPFCGSGTILSEALLMGFKDLIGTDISQKAINNTKANIEWLKKNSGIKNYELEIRQLDVKKLSNRIKPNSIDAIVTEPYLGPQRGAIDIKKTISELNGLYGGALKEFKKILNPAGRAVMLMPVFYKQHRLDPDFQGFKIINPLPGSLRADPGLKITERDTLIYGRPGQRVWREIFILKKR